MRRFARAIAATALVALGALPSGFVFAQSPGARVSATAPIDSQYAGALTALSDKVLALAEAIPADKYDWRPSSDVRSISEVFMHLAGEWYYLCPLSVAARPQTGFLSPADTLKKLEAIKEKAAVLLQLRESWAVCRAALNRTNPARLVPDSLPGKMSFARVVLLVSGDQHEHLGQLIAYARSVGVAPPWSK
jgi:uncharacterized damage-inducible protein DinB